MRVVATVLLGIFIGVSACQHEENADPIQGARTVTFYTPDRIKIYGDLYVVNKAEPIILLFHQGGSNARGEYRTIIPKLIEMGVNVLAIDQRMGGQIYGSYNRTIADIPDHSFDNPYSFCDAYNNLESALDFVIASEFSGPKILWGSSYSASLAIQLASQRQEAVQGVLAFSPASGGPMAACRPDQYFQTLAKPLLLLRPPNEMESESAQAQFELAQTHNHQTFVAQYGVHGSSMLVPERVEGDIGETWEVVTTFLNGIINK